MIKTIGLFPNPTKENWRKVTEKIISFLQKKKTQIVMDPAFLAKYPLEGIKNGASLDDAEIIISLGGDGTLLQLVGSINNYDRPILGVNLGTLGFLTEFTVDSLHEILDKVIKGDFRTQRRIALHSAVIRNNKVAAENIALNDVVIGHEKLARLLSISVFFDEKYVTTYKADGLIVCTPTGSTAYSLSAGGPIVEPTLEAILLTPICPHTITNRPIIIPADKSIRITLPKPGIDAAMTIDGQICVQIKRDDEIEIKQSPKNINLITSSTTSFFGVLQKKLGWNESDNSNLQ